MAVYFLKTNEDVGGGWLLFLSIVSELFAHEKRVLFYN